MKVKNLHTLSWGGALLGGGFFGSVSELDLKLSPMMSVAVEAMPDSEHSAALSEGVFELRTCTNDERERRNLTPMTQMLFSMVRRTDEERDYAIFDDSESEALKLALDAATNSRCALFPGGMCEDLLPTGIYRYHYGDFLHPLVMALNTADGQIYAAFVHDHHNYSSAQNSLFTSVYLFHTVARAMVALRPKDVMLRYEALRLTSAPCEPCEWMLDKGLKKFSAARAWTSEMSPSVAAWENRGLSKKFAEIAKMETE